MGSAMACPSDDSASVKTVAAVKPRRTLDRERPSELRASAAVSRADFCEERDHDEQSADPEQQLIKREIGVGPIRFKRSLLAAPAYWFP